MAAAAARNKIMVLNAGSSSLKFKLFQMGEGGGVDTALKAVASGICERVGDPSASYLRVRCAVGAAGLVGAAHLVPGSAAVWHCCSRLRSGSSGQTAYVIPRAPLRPAVQAKVGGGQESRIEQALPNHTSAIELVSQFLGDAFRGVSLGGRVVLQVWGMLGLGLSGVWRRGRAWQASCCPALCTTGLLLKPLLPPLPPIPTSCHLLPRPRRTSRRRCTGWGTEWCTAAKSASPCSSRERRCECAGAGLLSPPASTHAAGAAAAS